MFSFWSPNSAPFVMVFGGRLKSQQIHKSYHTIVSVEAGPHSHSDRVAGFERGRERERERERESASIILPRVRLRTQVQPLLPYKPSTPAGLIPVGFTARGVPTIMERRCVSCSYRYNLLSGCAYHSAGLCVCVCVRCRPGAPEHVSLPLFLSSVCLRLRACAFHLAGVCAVLSGCA